MMKDMDKKGDLPLSLLATIGKQNSGSAAPRRASSPAPAAADSSRCVAHLLIRKELMLLMSTNWQAAFAFGGAHVRALQGGF